MKSWQCTVVERILSWNEFINNFLTHWHSLALNFISPASVVAVTFDDQVEIRIKGHMVWFAIVQCFQRLIDINKGFSCIKCHTCYLQAFLNQFCNCMARKQLRNYLKVIIFWSSDNLELWTLMLFSPALTKLWLPWTQLITENIETRVLMLLKAPMEILCRILTSATVQFFN